MRRTRDHDRRHAIEITVFVCGLILLLLLVHACAGGGGIVVNPIEPPAVVTGSCQSGCGNLASPSVGCLKDAAACIDMCNDVVMRNAATWVYNMTGPTCWSNAKSVASAAACPGWNDAGCQ